MRLSGVLLAFLTACAAPIHVETPPIERGTVRAWTESDAEELVRALAELDPPVRELLESERETPRVWMADQPTIDASEAITFDGLIVLGANTMPYLRRAVCHELAHWHSFNDTEFPQIVEEGIAMYVEVALGISEIEIESIDPSANWRRAFSLDVNDWSSVSDDESKALYLAGYWLVRRIGLDRLRAMHARRETSPSDIARAAGLSLSHALTGACGQP